MFCIKSIRFAGKILKPHRKKLVFPLLLSFFNTIIGIFLINSSFSTNPDYKLHYIFAAVGSGIIFAFLTDMILHKIAFEVKTDLVNQNFRNLIKSAIPGLSAEKMKTATEQSAWIADTITPLLRSIFRRVFQIVIFSVYLLYISPGLTIISFLLSPMVLMPGWILGKYATKARKEAIKAESEVYGLETETARHLNVIKIYDKTDFMGDYHHKLIRKSEQKNLTYKILHSTSSPLSVLGIISATAILYTASIFMTGHNMISSHEVAAFFTGLAILYAPISGFSQDMLILRHFCSPEIFSENNEINQENTKFKHPENHIEIQNISFSYTTKPLLKNISFTLKSGEITGIAGKNGSGKTTLAYIISGIIKNHEGKILVDGIPAYPAPDSTGYSDQNGAVFTADLNFNVKFGRKASSSDLPSYISEFEHHNKLYPARLSGGQKKLIDFARATFQSPKFLILDEPDASLSPENVNMMINHIKHAAKNENKIILILTHNQNLLNQCDKVINL